MCHGYLHFGHKNDNYTNAIMFQTRKPQPFHLSIQDASFDTIFEQFTQGRNTGKTLETLYGSKRPLS